MEFQWKNKRSEIYLKPPGFKMVLVQLKSSGKLIKERKTLENYLSAVRAIF
jgi:hypothetical protein